MLEERRKKFKKTEIMVGKIFSKLGLSPNQYTLISLIFILFSFYCLINQKLILSLIFFLMAALLDFIDGVVAKFTQKETKKRRLFRHYLRPLC